MPKKSAFFYYMLEYKDKSARKGKIISLEQASVSSGPAWNRMNPEQRKPYEIMAKTDNTSDRHVNEKLSAQGVPMSLIMQQQEDRNLEVQRMEDIITKLVQNSYFNNCMETQTYYFIMGNYFCKISKGIYIPAELAIVEYSLRDGVMRSDFWYLKKDKLPEGYAYAAKSHSDSTHHMPIPPDAMGITNWSQVLHNLIRFITADNGKINPMFTFDNDVPIMKSIVSQLCDTMPNAYDVQDFDIFSATQLLFKLKQAVCKYGNEVNPIFANGYPSIHIANDLLDRDNYDYTMGLACEFHEENDAAKFCALSRCKRLAYMISDNICKDLNIEFIPGRHLPLTSEIDNFIKSEPGAGAGGGGGRGGDTFSNESMIHSDVTIGGQSSNYTQPKFEKKRYNTDEDTFASCSSTTVDIPIGSKNEFPSLGALGQRKPKNKKKTGTRTTTTTRVAGYNIDEDDGSNDTVGDGGDDGDGGGDYSSSSGGSTYSEYFKKHNLNNVNNNSKPLNIDSKVGKGSKATAVSRSSSSTVVVPVDDNNPWALRMKTTAIAREPNEESFQFTTIGGSGRGSLISNLTQSERSSNICLGRGRNGRK